MLRDRVSTAVVVAIVLALVISPITGVVGPASAGSQIQTYSATENVSVWERAPLPFRLDTDDAAKSIQNGALDVEYKPEGSGPQSARKQTMAVYDTDTAIDATFKTVSGADTDPLAGKDTKLVIARMEPSQDGSDSLDTLPTSLGEAQDFFDTEDANQNASFDIKDTGTIKNDGSLGTSVSFDQSGAYALFLTTGDAVDVTNGEISVNGDTTIVGMDAAIVEEAPADVTNKPSSVVDGNAASFTVDTPTSEKTNVSVALYDTSKWTNSDTLVSIDEEISSDLSAENVTIEHSIVEVNGEAKLADSYSMFGVDVGPASRAGTFSAGSIIQFLTEEVDDRTDSSVSEPKTTATDDTVMDASMVTKVNETGSVTVDLQTYENWSTGEYTWVVVTGGNDAGDIQTDTGTLDVKEKSSDDDDDNDGGDGYNPSPPYLGGDDDDDDDDGDSGTPPTDEPDKPKDIAGAAAGSSVTEDRGAARVNITGTSPGAEVTVDLPTNESEIERNGVGLTQMQFNTTKNTSASMTVRSSSSGTDQVSSESDLGYIEIDEEISPDSVSSASYTFTVTEKRLEERGVAPEDVALFRNEDGGWNELETTLISNTSTQYTFKAKSPGLSLYAISKKGSAQPNIQVTDAAVDLTSVEVAEPVEVTATLENTGNAEGSFEAVLEVDGDEITTQSVTVASGETATVTFQYSFGGDGERTVGISGVTAGTVDVSPRYGDTTTTQPPTTTTTEPTTTTPSGDGSGGTIPGFGMGVAMIALIAAALIAIRE